MSILSSLFLAIPCLFPLGWRVFNHVFTQPAGLLSDLGLALILYAILLRSPRWLKAFLLIFWSLTQIMSQELLAAMQRLPSWQDLQYLVDPTFVKNTTAGMHLAHPDFALFFALSTVAAILITPRRPGWGKVTSCLLAGLLLLGLHSPSSRALNNQSVAARYNPLHWFVTDASAKLFSAEVKGLSVADLPQSLRTVDLDGKNCCRRGGRKMSF